VFRERVCVCVCERERRRERERERERESSYQWWNTITFNPTIPMLTAPHCLGASSSFAGAVWVCRLHHDEGWKAVRSIEGYARLALCMCRSGGGGGIYGDIDASVRRERARERERGNTWGVQRERGVVMYAW
jgi:hypothetical protein